LKWEPLRSKHTGNELAAGVQVNIDHLRSDIARREQRIKELLA
jgi:hypothetical protein